MGVNKPWKNNLSIGIDNVIFSGALIVDLTSSPECLDFSVAHKHGSVREDREILQFLAHSRARRAGQRHQLTAIYDGKGLRRRLHSMSHGNF
jgi:hypothetical protein